MAPTFPDYFFRRPERQFIFCVYLQFCIPPRLWKRFSLCALMLQTAKQLVLFQIYSYHLSGPLWGPTPHLNSLLQGLLHPIPCYIPDHTCAGQLICPVMGHPENDTLQTWTMTGTRGGQRVMWAVLFYAERGFLYSKKKKKFLCLGSFSLFNIKGLNAYG